MDPSQELLFGRFPRAVGVPEQWIVHSASEFDFVVEMIDGRWPMYSTISHFPQVVDDGEYEGYVVATDKVVWDLDSPAKAEKDDEEERWKHPKLEHDEAYDSVVRRMREDEDLADAILGPVCEDAQKLADASANDDIPYMAVFSGFGIHFYQFYELEYTPDDKPDSIGNLYVEECGLDCWDHKVTKDTQRLLRVPNVERGYAGEGLGIYTVPLTPEEVAEVTPQDLLELSREPRPSIDPEVDERREMPLYEDYVGERPGTGEGTKKPLSAPTDTDRGAIRALLPRLLQMPCVYERALRSNPRHEVRYNVGALLFNLGYTVSGALNIIEKLNWVDYDRETTRKQLESIWNGHKGEKGCMAMQSHGLCMHPDNPEECPTFDWRGGNIEWK